MRVLWPGACFGVVLNGEHRFALQRYPAIGTIKQTHMRFHHALRQRSAVHGKAVVHGDDFDFVGGVVFHRMIGAVVALVHF